MHGGSCMREVAADGNLVHAQVLGSWAGGLGSSLGGGAYEVKRVHCLTPSLLPVPFLTVVLLAMLMTTILTTI